MREIDYPTASSAKSAQSLFSSLHAYGLPNTADAQAFVNEVYNQAPRKTKRKDVASDSRKQLEKDSKELYKQRYSFVVDEDDSVVSYKEKAKSKAKDHSRKDRHSRKRETDGREWESDEEETARKRLKSDGDEPQERDDIEPEPQEDEGERRERDRERDLEERDAFAERMRERDKDRTKKVVEDRSSKGLTAEVAYRRQLADDTAARVAAMPSLRERSRQDYLTKRELQQIELLRKGIEDDEALFQGMKISKREKKDLEYRKEVLKLAEERMKIDDRYDGYQLPEDYITEQGKIDRKKKESVLYQRYEEAKTKDDQFVTDVDQWEASQTKHSTFKTGALDKPEIVEEYDYVFDESQTIQFVLGSTMNQDSHMTPAERLLKQQIEEAEHRGASIMTLQVILVLTLLY